MGSHFKKAAMWQDALEKSSNLFDSLLPFDNTKISEDY